MMATREAFNPWIVGGVAVALVVAGGVLLFNSSQSNPKPKPVNPPKPSTTPSSPPKPSTTGSSAVKPPQVPKYSGCGYSGTLDGQYSKNFRELEPRIKARILEANPGLGQLRLGDTDAASWLAHCIAGECMTTGVKVPVDLAVAVARRESNFNLHVDAVTRAIERGGARGTGAGSEIGPFQCKPVVFADTGADARALLKVDMKERVRLSVRAGVRYLARCRSVYRPGESVCEVLYCYTEGPTGSRDPVRRGLKSAYVKQIIAWANAYSELRNGSAT
jgi:hypothetical protein